MWRHAVNGYMLVTGTGRDFLILGPLRGGGVLTELGWISDVGVSCTARYAAAITGSSSPTIANLVGGTQLIQRSNDASGVFGVPTITLPVTSAQYSRIVLPMSVRLDSGGQYVIVGIQVATADVALHTVAWALELGGPVGQGHRVATANDAGQA